MMVQRLVSLVKNKRKSMDSRSSKNLYQARGAPRGGLRTPMVYVLSLGIHKWQDRGKTRQRINLYAINNKLTSRGEEVD